MIGLSNGSLGIDIHTDFIGSRKYEDFANSNVAIRVFANWNRRIQVFHGPSLSESELLFESVLLHVESPGFIHITLSWENSGGSIWIEGIDITKNECSQEPISVVGRSRDLEGAPPWSAVDPEAERACSMSVGFRATRFAVSRVTSRNPKSLNDQREELANAIRAMSLHIDLVAKGDEAFVAPILASLRALLCYKTPHRASSDPLLFRLAANERFGLPIYFGRIWGRADGSVVNIANYVDNISAFNEHPTMRRNLMGLVPGDLQDWFEDIAAVRGPADATCKTIEDLFQSKRAIDNNSFLFETASQIASHYDPGLSEWPELARTCKTMLPLYCINVGRVVVELSDLLLTGQLPKR